MLQLVDLLRSDVHARHRHFVDQCRPWHAGTIHAPLGLQYRIAFLKSSPCMSSYFSHTTPQFLLKQKCNSWVERYTPDFELDTDFELAAGSISGASARNQEPDDFA